MQYIIIDIFSIIFAFSLNYHCREKIIMQKNMLRNHTDNRHLLNLEDEMILKTSSEE